MIGYLRGSALARDVLDVGGVGYLVFTPRGLEVGSEVELYITTIVKEASIVLYGFPRKDEQDLFGALVRVNGIGPGSALALLSQLGVDELVRAVAKQDLVALGSVKGIGPKAAKTIITMVQLPESYQAASRAGQVGEIAQALKQLGMDSAAAAAAAAWAYEDDPEAADDIVLSKALAYGKSHA